MSEKLNGDWFSYVQHVTTELDNISPSMCMAKWLQSTVTLYNGYTHSCHHPVAHKIDISRLSKNYKELHNTPTKINARQDMLNGRQTKECGYCWNIENGDAGHLSDRSYKSASPWAWEHKDKVLASKLGENINPTYLEVAFDSTCNFKCTYCSPDVSSRIMDEIKTHGPYQLTNKNMHDLEYLKQLNKIPIHYKEYNPYTEAFWQWWPELYESLNTFRITGGEPLLSDHTWKIFEYVVNKPRKDFTLAINTNMGVPRKLIEKLVNYSNQISINIKKFEIFTSAETFGKQCEYIRHGMVWDEFTANCEYFLKNTSNETTLGISITANLLSAVSFTKFLEWILYLRKTYNTSLDHNRIPIMIAYIRWPEFLSITNLTNDLKETFTNEWTDFVNVNSFDNNKLISGVGFYKSEIDQIDRLCEFMNSKNYDIMQLSDFNLFYTEYDKRRNENFLQTFPELKDFWKLCEQTNRRLS